MNATLLVIEDDAVQRRVTVATLEREGYCVLEAADGSAGLTLALEGQPDLIVCDVMMPGINGYQFVTAVRQSPSISDTPVLLLSAMGKRADVRTGMAAGADDYLSKPFRSAELFEAVSALLARKRQRHEATTAGLASRQEELALAYEVRLLRELDTRWMRSEKAAADQHHEGATLLLVDVLDGMQVAKPDDPEAYATAARRAFRSARDTLYLFGARVLLPSGNRLLAVFTADTSDAACPSRANALRAASTLAQAAVRTGSATPVVALHAGTVTLVQVDDPLHGEQGAMLPTGSAVDELAAIHRLARELGWHLAASAGWTDRLAQPPAQGRTATAALATGKAVPMVELLKPA